MKVVQASQAQVLFHEYMTASTTEIGQKRVPCVFAVHADIDLERLRKAVLNVIWRHESLRTCIAPIDGHLVQVVRDMCEITEDPVVCADWDGTPQSTIDVICGLDDWWTVTRELAIRVVAGRSPQRHTLLVCAFNHALSDALSAGMAAEHIRQEYEHPGSIEGPLTTMQFSDYHAAMLRNGQAVYDDWLSQIGSVAPAVPQWMLEQKVATVNVEKRLISHEFSAKSVRVLRDVAAGYRCTPFEVLATCTGIYFRRPDRRPVGIGVIHSGRHRPRDFEVSGLLRSFVLAAADFNDSRDVRQSVVDQRNALRRAIAHLGRLPAEEVCHRAGLSMGWRAGQLGPWEVELNGFHDAPPTGTMGGVPVQPADFDLSAVAEGPVENGGALFYLAFNFGASHVSIKVRFINPPIDSEQARRVAADLESLLAFVHQNPSATVADAPAFW